MIEQTVGALTPVIGTRPCRAVGASAATIYPFVADHPSRASSAA